MKATVEDPGAITGSSTSSSANGSVPAIAPRKDWSSLATLTELRRTGQNREANIRYRTIRIAFKLGKCFCCGVFPENLQLGSNQCEYCVESCDVFYHHPRGAPKGQVGLF